MKTFILILITLFSYQLFSSSKSECERGYTLAIQKMVNQNIIKDNVGSDQLNELIKTSKYSCFNF